jgi:hypothetical protein
VSGSDAPVTPDGGRIADFYAWAMGDLRGNAVRGLYAEWLVARAVGAQAPHRVEWDNYDVMSPEGVKIEVKTGAFVQAWSTEPSTRIVYSGLKAREWLESGGTYSPDTRVRADVYVFALQTCKEVAAYDALDLAQWEFRVASGAEVRAWNQKSIGLNRLMALNLALVPFAGLDDAVEVSAGTSRHL